MIEEYEMKIAITIKRGNFEEDRAADEFATEKESETVFGRLVLALADEKIWSDEYKVSAFFSKEACRLCIFHSAFLDGRPLIIDSVRCSGELTVDGVEKAVLAHISAQLKILQEQSAALQLTSASLSDAQRSIFRAEAEAAVVARLPEADGCREFAPYGGSDLTCFILGHSFGHTIFVAHGTCPEFKGGIVQIDMPGDEWVRMKRAKKYERFWAELAMDFVVRELKIPKDCLYWQKTFVKEDIFMYHATEVHLRRQSVNEQIVITFDVDSLPVKAVRVPDEENAEM